MKRLAFLLLLTACHTQPETDALVCIQIQDRNGLTETISAPDRLNVYQATDFLSPQPYQKVMRVYRSDGKHQSTLTTYHPNGQLYQYLEAREMRACGTYREWHANGQLRIEASVIGGIADLAPGAEQSWLFDGVSRVYDESGHLIALIPYDKGALHGDLLSYHESGAVLARCHYERNQLHGKSFQFYPDRSPAFVETYFEDRLESGHYWNPAGDLIASVENGNGWQVRGETHIQIQRGMAEGSVRKPLLQYSQRGGKRCGEEICYYPSQSPQLSVQWDNDEIHGMVKTWYPNGVLQSQREYAHNQKMGLSVGWYSDGSVMFREEYEHDRLMQGQYFKRGENSPYSTVVNGCGTATLFDEAGHLVQKISYPVEGE